MKRVLAAILCAGILLLNGTAGAATISTLPHWDGTSSFAEMGEPDTATYGQTFRIRPGTDTALTSVTFYINDFSNHDAIDFALYVYRWTGTRITGDALYASPVVSTRGAFGFEAVTFNNINVDLAPGDYVAFGSASSFFDGFPGQSEWGRTEDDNAYTDGTLVFMNNGSDFNLLFDDDWITSDLIVPADLVFEMEFDKETLPPSPVPEPSTFLLVGVGIAGIGLLSGKIKRS